MADLWYARVKPDGTVYEVFCDDHEKPREGDIPLDPQWYWGQAPGICISDPVNGFRFTLQNGRLVPRYDDSKERAAYKEKKIEKIDNPLLSPIIGKKRKENLSKAQKEAKDHLDACINTEEITHTLLIGY
jgi:hypothetical protein